MRYAFAIFAAVLVAAAAVPAAAHTLVYTATLNGANENPVNGSLGTGFFTITLDLDLVTMNIDGSYTGLGSNVTAAHIHCSLFRNGGNAFLDAGRPQLRDFLKETDGIDNEAVADDRADMGLQNACWQKG